MVTNLIFCDAISELQLILKQKFAAKNLKGFLQVDDSMPTTVYIPFEQVVNICFNMINHLTEQITLSDNTMIEETSMLILMSYRRFENTFLFNSNPLNVRNKSIDGSPISSPFEEAKSPVFPQNTRGNFGGFFQFTVASTNVPKKELATKPVFSAH